MTDNLSKHIVTDFRICAGQPRIKGTQIQVSRILDCLAIGLSEGQLRMEYPQLSHEDVLAAIAYRRSTARRR